MTTSDCMEPADGVPSGRAAPAAGCSIVRLNVGGVRLETTIKTLVDVDPHSMLARLIAGPIPPALDADGAIFIDRDGDLFRHALAWLRDGARAALPADPPTLRALAVEADYFQLSGLADAIAARLPGDASADPASARARARAAGPEGLLDSALVADGGRLLDALELLVKLAYGSGERGGARLDLDARPSAVDHTEVACTLRGRGRTLHRRPGAFDFFEEAGEAAGPAGRLAFSRALEPALDAPLLFGGGYDKAVYGRRRGGSSSPPPQPHSPSSSSPPTSPFWPASPADRNLLVYDKLAAEPLPDPAHAALKAAILAVAAAPRLAAALLVRRLGFAAGTHVVGCVEQRVTWRPSCTYGSSDVFEVAVADARLTLKF